MDGNEHLVAPKEDPDSAAGGAGATEGESPYVAVPAFPRGTRQHGSIVFKQVLLDSGERAVMAFTTREKLIEAFGEFQPWLVIPLDKLQVLMGPMVDVVCVDPVVGDGISRWTRDDLLEALASQPENPSQLQAHA